MLDGARYFVAFAFVIIFPAIPLFWILGHGYVGLWRRLGTTLSYFLLVLAVFVVEIGLYSQHEWLLARHFRANAWLMVMAGVFYAAAVWLEILCRRHLSLRTLVGIPEFQPGHEQELLTSGIYSRLRHPRYLALILVLIAAAMFANYLALYLLVPVFVVEIWLVMILEERELVARFGNDYLAYKKNVPRLIPRLIRRH